MQNLTNKDAEILVGKEFNYIGKTSTDIITNKTIDIIEINNTEYTASVKDTVEYKTNYFTWSGSEWLRRADKWIRPWNIEKFDELSDRDERFFSLVIQGALAWLNRTIKMYDKGIRHFIFNTGSSYLYIESNGYEFSWCESTGEDTIYMETPRCIVDLGNFAVPTAELTSPFIRGIYERKSSIDGQIRGYNAEIRRLPIELTLNLKYVLSTFNESIVLLQEIFNSLIFQKYFSINYLGQTIDCSIELSPDTNIEVNKIDMSSTTVNQKNISLAVKICSNYPVVNEKTEIRNDSGIISGFVHELDTGSDITQQDIK